jgi:hypothetical protein
LEYRLDVLLSKELLKNFFYVSLSQVILYIAEDGLTWFSLFNLFGRQRERGEQLDEYLDKYLIHSVCRRDLGIDVEALQKVIDRLE